MLLDFGCAVMRGEGQADMNAQFEVHAAEGTHFSLGNQSHQAPEVVAAMALKGKLRRGSDERVVVPLAGQDAFAAGVTLCVRLSVCVSHSLSQSVCLSLTRSRTPTLPPVSASSLVIFSSQQQDVGSIARVSPCWASLQVALRMRGVRVLASACCVRGCLSGADDWCPWQGAATFPARSMRRTF